MDTVSIAIVSHGDQEDVRELLNSFEKHHESSLNFEIILLENKKVQRTSNYKNFSFPIKLIENHESAGLAKNINTIFENVSGNYFCILNPDIVFTGNIFLRLINSMKNNDIDIISPLIMDPDGNIQDSFRNIPNPLELFIRYISQPSIVELSSKDGLIYPEWLAGMFLFMESKLFEEMSGYNEKYFLYFEDVDFCCRALNRGKIIVLDPRINLIHNAKRASKNYPLFLLRHVISATIFFFSRTYWKYKINKYRV